MRDEHPAAELGAALSFVALLLIFVFALLSSVVEFLRDLPW